MNERYNEALKAVETQKQPALNIYEDMCDTLLRLTDAELSHVVRAALEYYTNGVMPENLDRAEYLTFEGLRNGIDRSFETYRERQRQRTLAAIKRWEAQNDN